MGKTQTEARASKHPTPLPTTFYDRSVVEVARDLLGCVVVYGKCSGTIVEAEAYHDSEPACHAFVGLTPRTETLFGPPGKAYVYRSYGVHAMLNAVSEKEGVGAAVLIRALEPLTGIEEMMTRRGTDKLANLCSGPGKLTQAFGITLDLNNSDLTHGPIQILPRSTNFNHPHIESTRIGITKATELDWRFSIAGSKFVSRPHPRPVP